MSGLVYLGESKNKYSDNRGFSLVELIVVVLIMAIISGGVITSVVVIHNADVNSAADKTVAVLNSARSYTISKADGSIWFELCKISGEGYYGIVYQGDKIDPSHAEKLTSEKIGGETLAITVKKTNSDNTIQSITVTEDNPVEFNFVKASGSLKEDYCDILISGSKDKNIVVIKETGRFFVE